MLNVKFRLTGVAALTATLKELPVAVHSRVLRAATVAAARRIRQALRQAAPRGDVPSQASRLYGRTYQNIKVQRLKRGPRTWAGYRIHAGDAFWSTFYELGTENQPARPWFRPTFDANAQGALDVLGIALGRGLEREAERLARQNRGRR